MTKPMRKGAEEARSQLPDLLTAAQHGRQTIITRHGRPVAILARISEQALLRRQRSLLSLAGISHGLHGRASTSLDGSRALRVAVQYVSMLSNSRRQDGDWYP